MMSCHKLHVPSEEFTWFGVLRYIECIDEEERCGPPPIRRPAFGRSNQRRTGAWINADWFLNDAGMYYRVSLLHLMHTRWGLSYDLS